MTLKQQIKELKALELEAMALTNSDIQGNNTSDFAQGCVAGERSAAKLALAIIKKQEKIITRLLKDLADINELTPGKWVKYNDQQRINLNEVYEIYFVENGEFSFIASVGFGIFRRKDTKQIYWKFNTREEAEECIKWLDQILGVQEFKLKEK